MRSTHAADVHIATITTLKDTCVSSTPSSFSLALAIHPSKRGTPRAPQTALTQALAEARVRKHFLATRSDTIPYPPTYLAPSLIAGGHMIERVDAREA